ncbi:alpha/beta-hydrolase [Neoconidiobolus thromboides FSU 785]|nr:alpha/beta-hydrolase [Neoconidiobolus thromboides FSU 785]
MFITRPLPDNIHIQEKILYSDLNENNYFDLILPNERRTNSPVVVWYYSGAWVSKDIDSSINMAANLASRYGIVTALVHYPLSKKAEKSNIKHPIHVKDSLKGFLNVTSTIVKYGFNDKNVYIGGHCAGAHISSLIAFNTNEYILNDNFDNKSLAKIQNIKGVVLIDGIFDLKLLAKENLGYVSGFIAPAFGEDIKLEDEIMSTWDKASPQYCINSPSKSKLSPKVLLIHSTNDTLVNVEQSSNFSKKLEALNYNVSNINGDFGEHDQVPYNSRVLTILHNFIQS